MLRFNRKAFLRHILTQKSLPAKNIHLPFKNKAEKIGIPHGVSALLYQRSLSKYIVSPFSFSGIEIEGIPTGKSSVFTFVGIGAVVIIVIQSLRCREQCRKCNNDGLDDYLC